MHGQLRPDNRTNIANRPDIDNRANIGNRTGVGNRADIRNRTTNIENRTNNIGNRTNIGDRTNIAARADFSDRDRWSNNRVINNKPQWANIDNSTNINIDKRWDNAFTNVDRQGWWDPPASRTGYWNGWADGVRSDWGYYHRHDDWFNDDWWDNHNFAVGGWNYHYSNYSYSDSNWWAAPAWSNVASWFTWSAPQTVWSQPVYYDYGTGGNVTYQDNSVYVGGEQVATADEFAQSAMSLATVPPPASENEAAEAEWMPLGTFAVSMNENDVQPSQIVQLAVNKEGIVSGTLYNIQTDQAQAIQGQVDQNTQRVAFRIGESETLVAETGLYNLTQDEAPVLVHFGTDQVENYLLIRLQEPGANGDDSSGM